MIRYVLKRLLWLIPVIILVSFIVFGLMELSPGTIVDYLITGDMTPDDIAALKALYNLDKSMLYRYGLYMLGLVQGDLGVSLISKMGVFDTYLQRLPNTLILALSSTVIGVAIAIPLGIRAARKAGTATDTAATTFTLIGMSMPAFWLGLLMLLLFSMLLRWLPTGGNQDGIRSLIMPAVCSAMVLMAISTRQTRSSMLEILNADFLRTARTKGVPEKVVIRKHALGNALIPVTTIVGSSLCAQLAGNAIIEQVFAWPGVGRMLVEGMLARDIPVILGCSIMTTIVYVLMMLLVDVVYAIIDPRIKAQYVAKKRKSESADAEYPATCLPIEVVSAAKPDSAESTASAMSQATEDGYKLKSAGGSIFQTDDDADDAASVDDSYEGAQDYVTRENKDIVLKNLAGDDSGVVAKYKKRSQMGELWHRLVRNKSSLVGIYILSFVVLVALISLFMSFDNVVATDLTFRYLPPSRQFPFGTDLLGRNVFKQVVYGSRYSIIIGFGSVAISAIIGVILGSLAGYYGGTSDNIIMRVSDVLASIPGLLLGMVIMVSLGFNIQNLIIAVGIGGITPFIRMSRASILTVKGNEFVEAARAIGYSDLRIIATQVLPNGLSPIIVLVTSSLGLCITVAAALSFLGFGIPPPTPEWGTIISTGRPAARSAPWVMTFPGLAIMITVLGFNLLGDGLRDALDPKLKK